ncbi:MAG: acid shock protein [Oscillospiraceae bacterium]|nr:acid shock protein [Oscillospiraceae bacterium]
MKKLLAILLSALVLFSCSAIALAAETTDPPVTTPAADAADPGTAPAPDEDETFDFDALLSQDQTPVAATDSFKTADVKVQKLPGGISIKKPAEMHYVTLSSPESAYSDIGASRSAFSSAGYLLLGYDETQTTVIQVIRATNEYTKALGSYKKLSKEEKTEMETDAKALLDYTTGASKYTEVGFTNYAGLYCFKKVSVSGTANTVVYEGIKGGDLYEITYRYDSSTLSAADVKVIEDVINSLKISTVNLASISTSDILLYAALALIVLLAAAVVLLYLQLTKLKNSLVEIDEDEEIVTEVTENSEETEEFSDEDFAEPYNPLSESEEGEAAEEEATEKEEASDADDE